jgi:hypothetical protein
MKNLFLILIILLPTFINCQTQVVTKLKTKDFNFTIPNLKNGQFGLAGGVEGVAGPVLYKVGDLEHIIQNSADSLSPALHFIRKGNGDWEFENYYESGSVTGGFRNYSFIDTLGTIAFASHGSEAMQPWPYGDLLFLKTTGEKLNFKKITTIKSFYHSVGNGDLNGDGLVDVVGLHMGSNTNVWENWNGILNIDPWLMQKDSSFIQSRNIATDSNWNLNPAAGGAVLVADIDNDNISEIIKADYGQGNSSPFKRYSFAIFKRDNAKNKYYFYKSPEKLGVFENKNQGATSMKTADFNKDGKIDLAIATEGYPTNYIQIWSGNGLGDFTPGEIISYNDTAKSVPDSSNSFREFEIMDFDGDGWQDIVVHPFHYGSQFRIQPGPLNNNTNPKGWLGKGITLNQSMWKNTNGKFSQFKYEIKQLEIYPAFMKGFFIDGKLRFFGFESKYNPSTPNKFTLYDLSIDFCKNLIKPTFNTSKYSFCPGDSLKLSITNVNKGDTLKWFFGSKTDFTNVANKIFTDSSKIFVTRTDSLGCIISSDTIQLKKFSIPSSPTLSRDTDNNLVSNSIGNIWYKDGVKITDTTQKIKPTTNGIYTATTTQNGCTSSLSQGYYYLTNAVSNLLNGEYFKISPNPTSGELNINYKISSSKNINISVFDINGRAVLLNKKVESGSKVNLGSISKGNYIIQVKDGAGRLISSQKLVKE